MPGFRLLRLVLVSSVLIVALGHTPDAWAHESRPAYLEIKETAPGRYVGWSRRRRGFTRLPYK